MIFFVLICRDSHDIDDIFRKLTALYVGSTIYLYPVKPLDRQRSKHCFASKNEDQIMFKRKTMFEQHQGNNYYNEYIIIHTQEI